MNITQVLLSPRIGGAETLAASLEVEFRKLGVSARTIYLDPDGRNEGRLTRLRNLRSALAAAQPDVVLAHSYLPGVYARAAWGRRSHVHVVLHSATDDHAGRVSQWVERALGSRTASIVAVSASQRDAYVSHFPAVGPITHIPNGVAGAFTPKTYYSPSPVSVATVSRVAEQKRPEMWEQIAYAAHSRDRAFAFEWWGPLSQSPTLNRNVLEPRSGNAHYAGSTDDVASVLVNSDVLLHTASREAHSIVLLEAALTGTPVVYPDSIEPPEDHQVWEYRYKSNDPADALRVLVELERHWDSVTAISQDYAHKASERYRADATAKAYLEWVGSI